MRSTAGSRRPKRSSAATLAAPTRGSTRSAPRATSGSRSTASRSPHPGRPSTDLDFSRLERTDTTTYCPYKGTTSDYWSARIGDDLHGDIAWSYAYPAPAVIQIAGLVAFYDEKVDTFLDGVLVCRPRTKFSAGEDES
jgi:hypothetical protein